MAPRCCPLPLQALDGPILQALMVSFVQIIAVALFVWTLFGEPVPCWLCSRHTRNINSPAWGGENAQALLVDPVCAFASCRRSSPLGPQRTRGLPEHSQRSYQDPPSQRPAVGRLFLRDSLLHVCGAVLWRRTRRIQRFPEGTGEESTEWGQCLPDARLRKETPA